MNNHIVKVKQLPKKYVALLAFTFMFIMMLVMVSAQPPFIQQTSLTEGYEIRITEIGTIKQHTDFNYDFHVYNISNGISISNESTSCFFILENPEGTKIFEGSPTYADGLSDNWLLTIDGNNFSQTGNYAYLIQCNSTSLGGYNSVGFEVTPTGHLLTIAHSIPILMPLLVMLLMTGIFFVLIPFVEKQEYKLTFIILGAVFLIMSISYGVIASRETLYDFPLLYGFINAFYKIFIIVAPVGAFIVAIIAMFYVIKRVFNSRGYDVGGVGNFNEQR